MRRPKATVGSLLLLLACLCLGSCGGGRFDKEISNLLTEQLGQKNIPAKVVKVRITCTAKDLGQALVYFTATLQLTEPLYESMPLEVEDTEAVLERSRGFLERMDPVLSNHERESLPALPPKPVVYKEKTPEGTRGEVEGEILISNREEEPASIELLGLQGNLDSFAGKKLEEGFILAEDSDDAIRQYREGLDKYNKAVRELWDTKAKPAVEMLKKHPAIDGVATSDSRATPQGSDKWDVYAEFLLDDATQKISGTMTWRNPNEVQQWTGEIGFNSATKQPLIHMKEPALRASVRSLSPVHPNVGCQYLLDVRATGWSGQWQHPPIGGTVLLSAVRPSPSPAPVVQAITVQPPAVLVDQGEPAQQRFVAVKVSEEGSAVNVRIYDTKNKDWLDESTFRIETEPTLGQILELDGVRAVYVGEQDFGSAGGRAALLQHATPTASETREESAQTSSTIPSQQVTSPALAPNQRSAESSGPSKLPQPPSTSANAAASRQPQPSATNNRPKSPEQAPRYIAVPAGKKGQVMVYDTKNKRMVDGTVYNLKAVPRPGTVHKFGNLEATYVAP